MLHLKLFSSALTALLKGKDLCWWKESGRISKVNYTEIITILKSVHMAFMGQSCRAYQSIDKKYENDYEKIKTSK